jgi:hypothetical protein
VHGPDAAGAVDGVQSLEREDSRLAHTIELILLQQQADADIQAAFDRYEDYQEGRGELFMRQLDAALTL